VSDEPDIQTGLPAEVPGNNFARKPIPASAFRGDEAVARPFWDYEWDEVTAARFTPLVAFRAYRVLLESQAMDPYREGPFDRVWCVADRRGPFTMFGLQFAGRTITGSLHHDAEPWAEAVEIALDKLASELFPDPEPPGVPRSPERRDVVGGAFPQFRK
jgi:hypothetical protein